MKTFHSKYRSLIIDWNEFKDNINNDKLFEQIFIPLDHPDCNYVIDLNFFELFNSTVAGRYQAKPNSEMANIPLLHFIARTLEVCAQFFEIKSFEWNRNISEKSATGSQHSTKKATRNDFFCWIQNLIVFFGEEKCKDNGTVEDAKQQILKNTLFPELFFGPLPILFGYANSSNLIKFFAIDLELPNNAINLFPNDGLLDVTSVSDRLQIVVKCINIMRIFNEYCKQDFSKFQFPFKLCENIKRPGCLLYFTTAHLKKTIDNIETYKFSCNSDLRKLYNNINDIDYTINVNDFHLSKSSFHVIITPVCGKHIINSIKQLYFALLHICKGVMGIHRLQLAHRDLRWPNILYDAQTKRYLLTDFEHVGQFDKPIPFINPGEFNCHIPLDIWNQMKNKSNKYIYTMYLELYLYCELIKNALANNPGTDSMIEIKINHSELDDNDKVSLRCLKNLVDNLNNDHSFSFEKVLENLNIEINQRKWA